jgi:hypothetical protein
MGATATTQELPRHCIHDELIKNYYKLVINRLRWSKTKRRRMRMEGVDTNECKGTTCRRNAAEISAAGFLWGKL